MAHGYPKALFPGSLTTIADMATTTGGPAVTIQNLHASEPVWLTAGTTTITAYAFRLAAGKTFSVVLDSNDTIRGYSGNATVTNTVGVFRTGFPSNTSLA